MKLVILLAFLISCSSVKTFVSEDNYLLSAWEIIEDASPKNWNKEQLISKLGLPKEQYSHPKKQNHSAWIYFDKKTGFQEWGISINQDGIAHSVTYLPKDPYRHEFTIEKIMARWKNLNCSHKTKQELSPGLVKIITYLDCDNGHRIVKYNMYKEVESILVDY